MNASKVLMGVLGGVAVGAVAGILFAPAKGTKTRKRIMKKGNNLKKDMKTEQLYRRHMLLFCPSFRVQPLGLCNVI